MISIPQEKKLELESQLNKQLTELETMPQREVDRVIIHDIHGLPVKRHEGAVYKDPRDDPALGALGRDFLHSGTRVTTANVTDNIVGVHPIGATSTEGVIDEDPEATKKRGFLSKIKDKYHNWRERRRQKKLAREQGEQGEPISPLSPSPTNQAFGTVMDPTLADVKKTGHWDFPDQRMVTTQTTLREGALGTTNLVPNTSGVTQVTQTELKSGIIHPGLIQDFALKPQTEFLISQATATIQKNQEQVVNVQPVQMQSQPGLVIDDLTRPAKNLMEGVSGAYGIASNPFQPINDEGLQKLDRRLIKNPGAIEPRGVGVDNLQHSHAGLSSNPSLSSAVLSNVGGISNTGLSTVHQHMPVYKESMESQVLNTGFIENKGIPTTTIPLQSNIQPTLVAQGMPQSHIKTASNILEQQQQQFTTTATSIPGKLETEFSDLQAELIKKGAIKPTETILSVTPLTVEPGMAGDLENKLRGGRLLNKDIEKINANLPGSSTQDYQGRKYEQDVI